MSQLSFFSAESVPPAVSDLAGLLAASGQVVTSGDQARVSVVVEDDWRAIEIANMIEAAGLVAEITRSEEDRPLVRTARSPELFELTRRWIKGAVKRVPDGWVPGPRALRAWTVAAGRSDGDRFILGVDAHSPETHLPLAAALSRAGITPTVLGARAGGPALRISGRRRVGRLVENIGDAPAVGASAADWPRVSGV